MKHAPLFLGSVLVATTACGGTVASGSSATSATTVTGAPARRVPRRRAITAALQTAAERAGGCLPPSVAGVTVEGAFQGATGSYVVANVRSEQPLAADARECVREAFGAAHVDPFREARVEVSQPVSHSGGEAPAASGTLATVSGNTSGVFAPATATATATATVGAQPATPPTPAVATPAAVPAPVAVATPVPGPAQLPAQPAPQGPAAVAVATPPSTTSTSTEASPPAASTNAAPTVTQSPLLPRATTESCYRAVSRLNPAVGGAFRLEFTVTRDGAPQNVRATPTAVTGPAPLFTRAMRCIEQRARQATYAHTPPGGVDLQVTFVPNASGGTVSVENHQAAAMGALAGVANAEQPALGAAAPAESTPAPVTAAALDVLRGRVGTMRECYQRQLARDPQLELRLRVNFRIEPAGNVALASSTTVVTAGNPDVASEVGRCMEAVVRSTTFPARSGTEPLELSQPFVFAPDAAARPAAAPVATGRVDPAQVAAVVRGNVDAVRACYNRALASDSTLAGRVLVRFTVDTSGHVTAATAEPQPRAGNPVLFGEVARCISGVMRPLVFPAPVGGPMAFALPFDFGSAQ